MKFLKLFYTIDTLSLKLIHDRNNWIFALKSKMKIKYMKIIEITIYFIFT